MAMLVRSRVGVAIILGVALSYMVGATPNKAVETVEIDGKGVQKAKHHEGHHDEHEKKVVEAEHSHKKEVSHTEKESHETHDAKKAKETAHAAASHVPEAKAEEHPKHADKEHENPKHAEKEHAAHASHDKLKRKESVFSDEEEDDAALDELEAMTIARTFEKKHSPPWGPPAAVPCTWQEWENDGSCAFTCGGRGKSGQKQTRGKNPPKHGGGGCHGKGSKQIECAIEDCPTTTTTTEEEMTTTTAGGASRMAELSYLLASLMATLSMFAWAGH
jgi:hypothetical protein